jgi:cysteinyl-tRNA synthetase
MEEAVARVERIRNFFRTERGPSEASRRAQERLAAFKDALADDFNTPRAMAEMFELVGEANRDEVPGAAEAVAEMLGLVGLGSLSGAEEGGADAGAERLMEDREAARAEKDFVRADEIRDELARMGYEVRDSAEGPRLVPKS